MIAGLLHQYIGCNFLILTSLFSKQYLLGLLDLARGNKQIYSTCCNYRMMVDFADIPTSI